MTSLAYASGWLLVLRAGNGFLVNPLYEKEMM